MGGLLTSTSEEQVTTLHIDDPGTHNALGSALIAELDVALERADRDPAVRCIVIAGNEDAFATGADVLAGRGGPEPPDPAQLEELSVRLAAIGTPTVAAVSGWALGSGCELALACDMCVAAEMSQFGLPAVTLGLAPNGGAQRLARTIGKARTMELVLTGRRFDGEQAYNWGLVNRFTGKRAWLEGAQELAAAVAARGAPIAVRLTRESVLAAEQLPLSEGLALERSLHEQTLRTADRVEGLEAFAQGRPPRFQGR